MAGWKIDRIAVARVRTAALVWPLRQPAGSGRGASDHGATDMAERRNPGQRDFGEKVRRSLDRRASPGGDTR